MVSNTILITQARIGSTRLPGKVMEKIDHECLAKLYEAFESHK